MRTKDYEQLKERQREELNNFQVAMFKRHNEELHEALKDEEFAEAAFLYEMNNHEYAINWDGDDDVLDCFGLTFDKLKELNLVNAYSRARKAHYKQMEECGVI